MKTTLFIAAILSTTLVNLNLSYADTYLELSVGQSELDGRESQPYASIGIGKIYDGYTVGIELQGGNDSHTDQYVTNVIDGSALDTNINRNREETKFYAVNVVADKVFLIAGNWYFNGQIGASYLNYEFNDQQIIDTRNYPDGFDFSDFTQDINTSNTSDNDSQFGAVFGLSVGYVIENALFQIKAQRSTGSISRDSLSATVTFDF